MVKYPEVSYNTGSHDAAIYTEFLNKLRDTLKSGVVSHGIPVLHTPMPVTSNKRFALVILSSSSGATTTVALDMINAYVLGFQVKKHSYFFKDVAKDIYESKLFDDTKKARLPYGGSYQALHVAGANREKVPLGNSSLDNAANRIVKYADPKQKLDIATDLLVIIQMISEPARSRYIGEKLVEKFHEKLLPRGDVISLENKWKNLSMAVQTAKPNGEFLAPVQLKDENYKPYDVKKVSEVKPKMALLLAKESILLLIGQENLSLPCDEDLTELLAMV